MLRGRIRISSAVWLLMVALASASAVLPACGSVDGFALFGSSSKGWGFTSTSMISPGPTIMVLQNSVVNVTLTSADGLQHEFFIDYNGNGVPDADEPMSEPFTNTTSLLVKPSVAGTFKYFCALHPSVMYGTFMVVNGSIQVSTQVLTSFAPATVLAIGAAVAVLVAAAATVLVIMIEHDHHRHRRQ